MLGKCRKKAEILQSGPEQKQVLNADVTNSCCIHPGRSPIPLDSNFWSYNVRISRKIIPSL